MTTGQKPRWQKTISQLENDLATARKREAQECKQVTRIERQLARQLTRSPSPTSYLRGTSSTAGVSTMAGFNNNNSSTTPPPSANTTTRGYSDIGGSHNNYSAARSYLNGDGEIASSNNNSSNLSSLFLNRESVANNNNNNGYSHPTPTAAAATSSSTYYSQQRSSGLFLTTPASASTTSSSSRPMNDRSISPTVVMRHSMGRSFSPPPSSAAAAAAAASALPILISNAAGIRGGGDVTGISPPPRIPASLLQHQQQQQGGGGGGGEENRFSLLEAKMREMEKAVSASNALRSAELVQARTQGMEDLLSLLGLQLPAGEKAVLDNNNSSSLSRLSGRGVEEDRSHSLAASSSNRGDSSLSSASSLRALPLSSTLRGGVIAPPPPATATTVTSSSAAGAGILSSPPDSGTPAVGEKALSEAFERIRLLEEEQRKSQHNRLSTTATTGGESEEELRQQISVLLAGQAQWKARATALEEEISRLSTMSGNSSQGGMNLEVLRELQQLRAKVVALETERGAAVVEARAAKGLVETMQIEMAAIEDDVRAAMMAERQEEVSRLKDRIASLESLNKEYEGSSRGIMEQAAAAQRAAEQRLLELEKQLGETSLRLHKQQQNHRDKDAENQRLREQVASLIRELDSKGYRSKEDIASAQAAEAARTRLLVIERELVELREKHMEAEANLLVAKDQMAFYQRDATAAREQVEVMKEEMERLIATKNSAAAAGAPVVVVASTTPATSVLSPNKGIASLAAAAEADQRIEEAQRDAEEARREAEEARTEREKIQDELDQLREQSMTKERQYLEELRRMQTEVQNLQQQLAASAAPSSTANGSSSSEDTSASDAAFREEMRKELDELKSLLEQKMVELEEKKSELSSLNQSLEESRTQAEQANQQVQQLQQQITKLQQAKPPAAPLSKEEALEESAKMVALRKQLEEAKRNHAAELKDMNARFEVRMKAESRGETERLEKELETLKTTHAQQIKDSETTIADLRQQLGNGGISSADPQSSARIAELEANIENYKLQVEEKQRKIEQLEAQVQQLSAAAAAAGGGASGAAGAADVAKLTTEIESRIRMEYDTEMKNLADSWRAECARVAAEEQSKYMNLLQQQQQQRGGVGAVPPGGFPQQQQQQLPQQPQHPYHQQPPLQQPPMARPPMSPVPSTPGVVPPPGTGAAAVATPGSLPSQSVLSTPQHQQMMMGMPPTPYMNPPPAPAQQQQSGQPPVATSPSMMQQQPQQQQQNSLLHQYPPPTTPTSAVDPKKKGLLRGLFGGGKKDGPIPGQPQQQQQQLPFGQQPPLPQQQQQQPQAAGGDWRKELVAGAPPDAANGGEILAGDPDDDEAILLLPDGSEIEAYILEAHLKMQIPAFCHITVFGSARPAIGLVATLLAGADGETLEGPCLELAVQCGSTARTATEARADPVFQRAILNAMARANECGPPLERPACRVKRFAILAGQLTQAKGTLNPDGSVSRISLKKMCAAFIDTLGPLQG